MGVDAPSGPGCPRSEGELAGVMEAASIRQAPAISALQPDRSKVSALRGEHLALGATAVTIAMLPLVVPKGPANVAPADALIALALLACLLWAGTSGHRLRLPYVLPIGLIVAGGALGALVGPVPIAGIVALVQDAALFAWCWAVVNISHSAANLKILLKTWAYSAIVWVALLFVGLATGLSALTGQVANQGSRVQLTLADPSFAANYFFVSIMIIWATGRPRHRGMRLAAYVLLIAALVLTGSNSGMVSLIVGVSAAAALAVYRRLGVATAVTVLAVIALGGYMLASNVSLESIQQRAHSSPYAFIRDGVGRGTSADQRSMLFHESVELYRSGSLLGEGPVSTKPRLRKEMAPFAKEAHNDYFAVLTERGVIGFVGVLLLVASLGFMVVFAASGNVAEGFAATVPRPHALVAAVVGTLVAGTVYELLHVRHVWALFAFLAALCVWSKK